MTDLVERLRAADISGHGSYSALVREAADEIERLNGLAARQDGLIERLKAEIAEWKKVADASTPEAFRLQMKADGERDD